MSQPRGVFCRTRRGMVLRKPGMCALALAACTALGTVGASSAAAQTPDATPQASDAASPGAGAEAGQDIVVTGSRIRRNGLDAPTPTTVINAAEIESRGATNVADVLNEVPAFRPSNTPATTANSLGSAATPGGNLLDLRGLGAQRTLILLNGRRHVQTNQGAVDVNLIPQALVERVETVTGGASAAWGSDAISGVVNFILNDKLEGLIGSVQSGISQQGDNREVRGTLAYGTSFADGRGHIEVAGEYFDGSGIRPLTSRSWGVNQRQLISNAAYAPGNGQPQFLVASNVRQSNRTLGGLILSGRFRGSQFLPGGVTAPFDFGAANNGSYHIGGDGINQGDYQSLIAPVSRKTAYSTGSYDLGGNNVKAQFEVSYGESHTRNPVTSSFTTTPYTIRQDNAFLPTSLSTQMAPGETFTLGRLNTDLGIQTADIDQNTIRAEVGLSGDFSDRLRWSAYYEYGRSRFRNINENSVVTARLARSIDSVRVGGQAVCRVNANASAADDDPACVPINLFGTGSPSAAAAAYVQQDQYLRRLSQEHVAAAEIQGEPFSTWAGKASIAVGVEYRSESASIAVDPLSQAGGYLIGNIRALSGRFDVKEAFAETVIPLFKSDGVLRLAELNAAVRGSDYSSSGKVTTWKVGLSSNFADFARLRVTRSRDIRAANLDELFLPVSTSFQSVADPFSATSKTSFATVYRVGNVNLKPESADTWTAGLVLTPEFVPGLRASVDYYDVKVKDAIRSLAPQDIINRCAAGGAELCSLIAFNVADVPSSGILSVSNTNLNVASLTTRGIDFELDYRRPVAGGRLDARLLGTYVAKLATDAGSGPVDRAGEVGNSLNGGVPHWRLTGDISYQRDPVTVTFIGRFIGQGKYDNTYVQGITIDDNHVPAVFYLDGSVQFDINQVGMKKAQLIFAVRNIFDKDPPIAPTFSVVPYPTNPAFYDVVGRFFSVAYKFQI